ncbi:hypothetical protein [Collimonas pratensis]|uniref:Uncharacterized protein n=1 Tax=Collimonas pratensis TaxID=279113 RepID=A0ABM5Z3R6_9BURK|nr:hypothetical protein [Collimonas pratensis]AMP13693.1 hypothetical protein CPter291_1419 [Collimonas pratensis]
MKNTMHKTTTSKPVAGKPTAKKTHQVMVTFGVRSATLKANFHSLWSKTDMSEAGFARELIREGIERRMRTK